jgi:hypothetical protein
MAFLANNAMDFSHAFRHGIDYQRLRGDGEGAGGLCDPLQAREYGAETVFFGKEDRETIERIEKVVASEERARVDFRSKRVLDYFRGKYELSFDKTKKNMDRYEYDIRVFNKEEIEFEKDPKPAEQPAQLCEKVEEISL